MTRLRAPALGSTCTRFARKCNTCNRLGLQPLGCIQLPTQPPKSWAGKFLPVCEVGVTVRLPRGGGASHLSSWGEPVSLPIPNARPSSRPSVPRNRPWLAKPAGRDRIFVYLASASSQSLGQAVEHLLGKHACEWTVTYSHMRGSREVWLLERD